MCRQNISARTSPPGCTSCFVGRDSIHRSRVRLNTSEGQYLRSRKPAVALSLAKSYLTRRARDWKVDKCLQQVSLSHFLSVSKQDRNCSLPYWNEVVGTWIGTGFEASPIASARIDSFPESFCCVRRAGNESRAARVQVTLEDSITSAVRSPVLPSPPTFPASASPPASSS